MEHETQLVVLDQWEKPERAVARPFHDQVLGRARDRGFHVTRAFTQRRHGVPRRLERDAVAVPGARHRLGRVVKHVHIAREAMRLQGDAQADPTSNVALAASAASRG